MEAIIALFFGGSDCFNKEQAFRELILIIYRTDFGSLLQYSRMFIESIEVNSFTV